MAICSYRFFLVISLLLIPVSVCLYYFTPIKIINIFKDQESGSENKCFDNNKYFSSQISNIQNRRQKFGGKLYLEIGGQFFNDGHASRVLDGFDSAIKRKIFSNLGEPFDIILCISAPDIESNRIWFLNETYEQTLLRTLDQFKHHSLHLPKIAINLVDKDKKLNENVQNIQSLLKSIGYDVFLRYKISGYPHDLEFICSDDGFGQDQYIETNHNLILVIGLGSNSGKLSTCMGQIYQDFVKNIDSGYAKYELFPIHNIPLHHPINLAYEAATADIGDYNTIDQLHLNAYGISSVNYNRDVEAFPLLKNLINLSTSSDSYMRTYQSPTDMGLNMAKEGIINDTLCMEYAIEEIQRRIKRHQQQVFDKTGTEKEVELCEKAFESAKLFYEKNK